MYKCTLCRLLAFSWFYVFCFSVPYICYVISIDNYRRPAWLSFLSAFHVVFVTYVYIYIWIYVLWKINLLLFHYQWHRGGTVITIVSVLPSLCGVSGADYMYNCHDLLTYLLCWSCFCFQFARNVNVKLYSTINCGTDFRERCYLSNTNFVKPCPPRK